MSEIKIDKGVPLPEPKLQRFKKYPWSGMEVGDSFFVPGPVKPAHVQLATIANQRLKPKRFVARQENGGIRVWRSE